MTQANQFYIKARDAYDFSPEEAMENLNYALGHDPSHAMALVLMGRLHLERIHDTETAYSYFMRAFEVAPLNPQVATEIAYSLVEVRDLSEVARFITHLRSLSNSDMGSVYHLEALVAEHQRDYARALDLLNESMLESYQEERVMFLEGEIRRVEMKQQRSNRINYSC